VFVPAYHYSPMYMQNINIVHVSNVTVINNYSVANARYANQGVPGAVMVVPHDAFVQSRRVSEVAIVVPHEQIMRASVVGSTAPIAPVRESIVGVRAGVAVNAPPARFVDRQVVVTHQPPPPPVSFAAQEQALRANGGRPLDESQMNTVRRNAPAANPMVRNPNTPAGGFRPGTPSPGAGRPLPNDRPPSARPAVTQQGGGQPHPAESRTPETKTNEARPAERTTGGGEHATPQKEEKKAPPSKKRNEPTQKKG